MRWHSGQRQPSNPFSTINPHAAGIDIGATHHVVAVGPDRDPTPVRTFCTFSGDLHALADWLQALGITTVAMESTGVYWIPVFEILEARGFEVVLVNARDVKQVPGRKTDVNDAQWLQQLHQYGLLRGSFRPRESVVQLRAYLRLRERLIEYAAAHILHMQKALLQMNLQLHHAVTDITGATGMCILRAIVAGERALEMALQRRCPEIGLLHRSDQGCTYASEDYQRLLATRGIVCSMSRRGNCYDTAVMEAFFSTVKSELGERFDSNGDAKMQLFDYLEVFYNQRRRHASVGRMSPAAFERLAAPKSAA